MKAVQLREAVPADAPALLRIEEQCFVTDRIKPRQMRYLLTRARALNLVADSDARAVAYLSCLTPVRTDRPARLYSLAVAPDFRRRGLAFALLERLVDDLCERGYRRLRLEVRVGDRRTQALYQRFGFRELSRIEAYYEDGEAALRMGTTLPAR
ncbi:MAG: ribosomal-protein-alanine N-acetyltransferase [Glaciecola sp.]|jgi:ribosomal-protein-alanine N-acetyltransferase|uniref:GNAT family N-acetyltransferase n=1 Tax=Congregibacter sp. TaxID=2744308 RepID=UPI0039E29DF8